MVDKFDPVFAEDGSVDTDSKYDEYAANGFSDEVVRYKAFNKIIQMLQEKINEIIDAL